MHFWEEKEDPMSEKTCVGRNGLGEALEMYLGRWSGQRWLSGQQGKLWEGFPTEGQHHPMLDLQAP